MEKEINAQTAILNQTVIEKNKAVDRAEYWHSKQIKALKELIFWRMGALAIAGIIGGFIAVKLGLIGAKFFS